MFVEEEGGGGGGTAVKLPLLPDWTSRHCPASCCRISRYVRNINTLAFLSCFSITTGSYKNQSLTAFVQICLTKLTGEMCGPTRASWRRGELGGRLSGNFSFLLSPTLIWAISAG